MKIKEVLGKKIKDIAMGESFIEIELSDGSVLIVQSTDYKSTPHQEYVNINAFIENKKSATQKDDA